MTDVQVFQEANLNAMLWFLLIQESQEECFTVFSLTTANFWWEKKRVQNEYVNFGKNGTHLACNSYFADHF